MSKIKILVFSQSKTARLFVGTLFREEGKYCFCYDALYLRHSHALVLGVEMPLKPGVFTSKDLFPSLQDRIPEKKNPAYVDYCRDWNISPDEEDLLILLSTIGHRGPSSFLFRREVSFAFDGDRLRKFRLNMGLTVRDLAQFLDTSAGTISKTECGQLDSKWVLMLCEVLEKCSDALISQLDYRGMYLHDDKIMSIKAYLREISAK